MRSRKSQPPAAPAHTLPPPAERTEAAEVNSDQANKEKGCAGGKKDLSVLQGTWYYDQYTEYEFDGKGNGCMCIDKTNHYEFTYDIDGDTLKVDYALDYVTDCEYTYTVDGEKLTLLGGNGTAERGKVYELTKQE